MCEFDHSPGGYLPKFRQIAGGFHERFDHFAGGIRYSTTTWGVLADSTVLWGFIVLKPQGELPILRRFDQCPGGLAWFSDDLAGGYATHDLRSLLVRERMRQPIRAIY